MHMWRSTATVRPSVSSTMRESAGSSFTEIIRTTFSTTTMPGKKDMTSVCGDSSARSSFHWCEK